jgi:hypothetical protein
MRTEHQQILQDELGTHSETKRKFLVLVGPAEAVPDEAVQALGAEVKTGRQDFIAVGRT